MALLRTVVEEDRVKETIDQVRHSLPRIEEIFEGWKWRLSHMPEMGYCMPGMAHEIYLAKSVPKEPDHPTLLFIYRFDDKEVTILDLVILPAETH